MLYLHSLCQTSHQNPPEIEWIHPKGGNISQLLGLRLRLPHLHYALVRDMGTHVSDCLPSFSDEDNMDNWATQSGKMLWSSLSLQLRHSEIQQRERVANCHWHRYANCYISTKKWMCLWMTNWNLPGPSFIPLIKWEISFLRQNLNKLSLEGKHGVYGSFASWFQTIWMKEDWWELNLFCCLFSKCVELLVLC